MITCKCVNSECPQNEVLEFIVGTHPVVMCGVCRRPCELSEPYEDPATPNLGEASPE